MTTTRTTVQVTLDNTQTVEVVERVRILNTSVTGPAGPSGSAAGSYVHTQSTAAATWTINHNLGFNPQVAAFSTGGVEMRVEVLHPTTNQTLLLFINSTAGTARLN
jgi:hypothetical protein